MIVHKLQIIGIVFYVELPVLMLDFLTITTSIIKINSNNNNKNTINKLLQIQI
jgi:hypothetical protein